MPIVFENDKMYMLKNRKAIQQKFNGRCTICDNIDVIDIDITVISLSEEQLNDSKTNSLIYRMISVITKALPSIYDGFIVEGIKVKPFTIKK